MKNKALDLWFNIIHHGEDTDFRNQYLGFIKEEIKEIEIELNKLTTIPTGKYDLKDLRKEMMDVLVVIQGWYHKAGLSLEEDMNKVCASNFSKIYENQQEALDDFKNVQEKYKVKCFIKPTIVDDKVYYTIRRTEDGKILKPSKYKEAEL